MPSYKRGIRVLVADDSPVARQSIVQLISGTRGIDLLAESTAGEDALKICEELRPDVVLIGLDPRQPSAISLIRHFASTIPGAAILVLAPNENQEAIYHALEAGASGCVSTGATQDEILEAIRRVHDGELYPGQRGTREFVRGFMAHMRASNVPDPLAALTPRERELLPLLAEGGTDVEIASALSLSPHTVRTHRQRIMAKLDLHSTAELVRFAMRLGIIQ